MLTVGTLDGDDIVGTLNGDGIPQKSKSDVVDCVTDSSTAISVSKVELADFGS